MLSIDDERYAKIKPVAARLFKFEGFVDTEKLIAALDKKCPEVFDDPPEEVYHRYKLELICVFFKRWEREEKVRWLGVVDRDENLLAYYHQDDAAKVPRVARSARQEFYTGLTLLRTYGPYCEAWGEPLSEALQQIEEVMDHIKANVCKVKEPVAL